MTDAIVLIGDIVRSRDLTNRDQVQSSIRTVLSDVSNVHRSGMRADLTLIRGDEFEGVFSTAHLLPHVLLDLTLHFPPGSVRYGIGVGQLTTAGSDSVYEMDGPCFHRARQAVLASKTKKRLICACTGSGVWDQVLDGLMFSFDLIVTRWSDRQQEMVSKRLQLGSESDVALALGVNRSTVNRTLKRANYSELRAVMGSIGAAIDGCMK